MKYQKVIVPDSGLGGPVPVPARHFTFTVPTFTQLYKWLPANLLMEVTDGLISHPGDD